MDNTSPTTSLTKFCAWVSKSRPAQHESTIKAKHNGQTKLHRAVFQGDHEEVSRLLSENLAPKRRVSVLTMSVGDNAVAVNARDKLGRTALHWAAARGDAECARQLTMHPKTERLLKDHDGRTPLHETAIRGHEDVVGVLLEHEEIRSGVNIGDNLNRTALHWAAENGKRGTVQLLLEKGADVSRKDSCGNTPLHSAARNGRLEIAMMLVERGAKVQADMFQSATEGHHKVTFELLFLINSFNNGDEPTIPEFWRDTSLVRTRPILLAAELGYAAIVKQLLTTGKAEVNSRDINDRTPLGLAAMNGHTAVVEQLLATPDINVNIKDSDGTSPLMIAAESGHTAIVRQLLATEDVNFNLKNNDETALSLAILFGHTDTVQELYKVFIPSGI